MSNLVHSADFELRHISSIHQLLSTDATKILVSSFVFLCLDYCIFSLVWLSSVSHKQTTNSSKQRCLPCPESFQNWPYFSSCFSPLAAHWFTKTVQSHFSVLHQHQLDCLFDWTQFTNQPTTSTLILILLFCLPSVCMQLLGQRKFSYAAPSVWNSLPCKVTSSNTLTSFKSSWNLTCSHYPIVCLCVRVCVYVCVCVCVCVLERERERACVHVCASMHVCEHLWNCVSTMFWFFAL